MPSDVRFRTERYTGVVPGGTIIVSGGVRYTERFGALP